MIASRPAVLLAMLLATVPMAAADYAVAQEEEGGFADAPGADPAADPSNDALADPSAGTGVRTLGEGDQKLFLVDHDGTWSMHAQNVVTDQLLRLWSEAGGPVVFAKTFLDRPYTISVHRLEPERILDRLLEGYSYTLHYDGDGRLESVRVYSLSATAMFKTPRLVESLGSWRDVETAAPDSPAAAPGDGVATESSPIVMPPAPAADVATP
ncbi:MAG: hypothetical protein ABR587_15705 [Candidatus Binatia bacterium]